MERTEMLDEVPQALLRVGDLDLERGSGGVHEHLHPVDGYVQARIPLAGKAEISAAVDKAAAAFEGWRRQKPEARRDILIKLGMLMRENAMEFARLAALDGGVPLAHGQNMAERAAEWVLYYAGWADKLDGQALASYDTRGQLSYTMPEPYGVIGVIVTWNGPLMSLAMKVTPALAVGNCVVVKPAELTPFAPDLFMRLAREAGIPNGVLSILAGTPEAGEALVADRRVEKITFTGGPTAARKILVACAEQIKPAVLELGGKSGCVIYPDVDVRAVAEWAAGFTFAIMAGQGCVLPTRMIVHEDIHDQFVEELIAVTKGYKVGDPFEDGVKVGPIINAASCERIVGMLDRVRENKTGKIVLGGKRAGGELTGKNFVEPTIVIDVDPDSEVATTEVFGPVVIVMKFKDDDDAVRLANATPYGLGAFIQSKDVRRVHTIAERLKAGGVYANGAFTIAPYTPFGGLGVSGYGKEGARAGIEEFVRYKTVSVG
jgi:aldehyde dehydrogenase (NAD+)